MTRSGRRSPRWRRSSVGRHVTVYEREDRPGGLLMYGIPNMKLDKRTVLRCIDLLREEGVGFVTGTELGGGEPADVGWLRKESDALLLATGATVPRDLPVEGRDLPGVHFAMEYLTESTRALLDGRRLPPRPVPDGPRHPFPVHDSRTPPSGPDRRDVTGMPLRGGVPTPLDPGRAPRRGRLKKRGRHNRREGSGNDAPGRQIGVVGIHDSVYVVMPWCRES